VAERNNNPRIEGLFNAGTELLPGGTVPVCGDGVDGDKQGNEQHDPDLVPIEAAVTVGEGSGSSAELFSPAPTQVDAAPAPRREALDISWYATFGSLRGATYWGEGTTTDDEITFNELEFEQFMKDTDVTELPQGKVRIFAVLRDGRGGVDFEERDLSIPFISGTGNAVPEGQECFDVRSVVK